MSRDVLGVITTTVRYLGLAVVAWVESLVRPDLREHVPAPINPGRAAKRPASAAPDPR
jgi:hypothetical protein